MSRPNIKLVRVPNVINIFSSAFKAKSNICEREHDWDALWCTPIGKNLLRSSRGRIFGCEQPIFE